MLSRKDKKNIRVKIQRRYEEWLTRGNDNDAASYLGMTNKEYEDWLVYGKIPGRMLR